MDMLVRETQMMRKIGRFGVRDRKAEVQMVEDLVKHDRRWGGRCRGQSR